MASLSDFTGEDGNFDEILDLHDDFDIEDSYILKELCMKVKDFVEQLPDKEKIIVKLYYGFGIERPLFEKEIAEKLSLLQLYKKNLEDSLGNEDHLHYYLTVSFGITTYEAYLKWCEEAKKLLAHMDKISII